MSRLAKKPIIFPKNVSVDMVDNSISVKGPKGEIKINFRNDLIEIKKQNDSVELSSRKENKQAKMLLGTYASHIRNMIEGVLNGFKKKLIIEGVGYKADAKGQTLNLSLGFSHPVVFEIPQDISVVTEKNSITVSGINKERVGLIASKIRLLKKPEPYKGKGIRYENEIIKKKAGKKAAGSA